MLVNLEGSARINHLVGNHANHEDLFGIAKQLEIIASEVREGIVSLYKNNFGNNGFRDDVQDILFTVYGLFYRANINPERAFYTPTENNFKAYFKDEALDNLISYANVLTLLSNKIADHAANNEPLTNEDIVTITVVLTSLQTFAYNAGLSCGFPVMIDYAEVVRSNMTKFDTTLEDAEATRDKYAAIGIVTVTVPGEYFIEDKPYSVFICKSAHDQTGTDGKDYPGGKWLKSIRFREPEYIVIPEGYAWALIHSEYTPDALTMLLNPTATTEGIYTTVPAESWEMWESLVNAEADAEVSPEEATAALAKLIEDNKADIDLAVQGINPLDVAPVVYGIDDAPPWDVSAESQDMLNKHTDRTVLLDTSEVALSEVDQRRLRGLTTALNVLDEPPYSEPQHETADSAKISNADHSGSSDSTSSE